MHRRSHSLFFRGLALLPLLAASGARAEAGKSFVSLMVTKTDEISASDAGKAEHSITAFDFIAGFGLSDGIVLGGSYLDYGVDDNDNGDATTTIKGFGPMVGYLHPSLFYVTATYLYQPTKDDRAGGNGDVTYGGGSGYVFRIGKAFEINKSFGLAVQLTQAHVDYKTVTEADGTQKNLGGGWYDQMLQPWGGVFVFF
jgi:hypothetical protein